MYRFSGLFLAAVNHGSGEFNDNLKSVGMARTHGAVKFVREPKAPTPVSDFVMSVAEPLESLAKKPQGLPPDPRSDPNDSDVAKSADKLVAYLAKELNVGTKALDRWRNAVALPGSTRLEKLVKRDPRRWADTQEDNELLLWAVESARAVVHAHISLRKRSDGTTTFIAGKDIPAGAFLFSIPSDMCIVADPPAGADAMQDELLRMEDLALRVALAAEDPNDHHHVYAQYLRRTVDPPMNLPYISSPEKLESKSGKELWAAFHEGIGAEPQSELMAKMCDKEQFLWHMSVVLSRRMSSSTLIPLLDKMNHSSRPNCYYTMASPSSMCGVDLVDNLFCGVAKELLYEPYVHVFATRIIKAGQPLTISYSDKSIGTSDGRDLWRLVWGFVPELNGVMGEKELKAVAGMVAEQRLAMRTVLFPERIDEAPTEQTLDMMRPKDKEAILDNRRSVNPLSRWEHNEVSWSPDQFTVQLGSSIDELREQQRQEGQKDKSDVVQRFYPHK